MNVEGLVYLATVRSWRVNAHCHEVGATVIPILEETNLPS